MSGPSASRSRGLARLAGLFSLRTISGKLIIGLALLFGVASVAVSVVTDQSLNQSLMSSLNQQLQAATDTWYTCVQHSTGDPDHDSPRQAAYGPAPGLLRSGRRHVRGRADRQYLLQPQPGAREMRAL